MKNFGYKYTAKEKIWHYTAIFAISIRWVLSTIRPDKKEPNYYKHKGCLEVRSSLSCCMLLFLQL